MIEERLRELIEKKGLKAFTLWRSNAGWQANYSSDRHSWTIGIDDDPIKAIEKAFNAGAYVPNGVALIETKPEEADIFS